MKLTIKEKTLYTTLKWCRDTLSSAVKQDKISNKKIKNVLCILEDIINNDFKEPGGD